MRISWFALVPIALCAAAPSYAGEGPRQAPAPSVLQTPDPLPTRPATLPPPAATTFGTAGPHAPPAAPVAPGCAAPCAGCGHHADGSCCEQICRWLLFRPLKSCACHHHCDCGCGYIPTPPLYLYFLGECREGCGVPGGAPGCCRSCGAWRKCCATGHRMFAPPTGHNCCGGIN